MSRAAEPKGVTRRVALAAIGAAGVLHGGARAHSPAPPGRRGLVLPRQAAPALDLTTCGGRDDTLLALLKGRVTGVQLMFTGCSGTCPPQGALFAALGARLRRPDIGLLSLSIDALGDSPRTLSAWLDRFGRHPAWSAAVPRPADVETMTAFMTGQRRDKISHSTQVCLFDREARLAFRTVEHPTPEHVADLLDQLARA